MSMDKRPGSSGREKSVGRWFEFSRPHALFALFLVVLGTVAAPRNDLADPTHRKGWDRKAMASQARPAPSWRGLESGREAVLCPEVWTRRVVSITSSI